MAVLSDSEAMEAFGLTEGDLELLEREAGSFDLGEWPSGTVTRLGGPGAETRPVSFRLLESKVARVDELAAKRGISRGDALREAVDGWLMQA